MKFSLRKTFGFERKLTKQQAYKKQQLDPPGNGVKLNRMNDKSQGQNRDQNWSPNPPFPSHMSQFMIPPPFGYTPFPGFGNIYPYHGYKKYFFFLSFVNCLHIYCNVTYIFLFYCVHT